MTTDLELKIASTPTTNAKDERHSKNIRKILMGIVGGRATNVKVLMTYAKVTKTKKRIKGEDFDGKDGLVVNAVKGEISNVRLTKTGNVTFTVKDENRGKGDKPFGWTTCRIEGVIAVSLEGWKKGPSFNEKPVKLPEPKPIKNEIVDEDWSPDFSVEAMGK